MSERPGPFPDASLLVDCAVVDVAVTATGPLRHRCPFVDEVDEGTVTVEWVTNGSTFELHALRDYLDGWDGVRISHEEIAAAIAVDLDSAGISDLKVTTFFKTAGFVVTSVVDEVP